jgi:acyl-CoA thioester hydrolase
MNAPDEAFEMAISVLPSDIDQLGHVNNVTYLRWVQDVAIAHWQKEASPEDQKALGWVVARHEIDYKRPAFLKDSIIARTWVGTATEARFERHTELLRAEDRRLLAKAHTFWCPVNAKTGRPTRVSTEVRARFSIPPMPPTGV